MPQISFYWCCCFSSRAPISLHPHQYSDRRQHILSAGCWILTRLMPQSHFKTTFKYRLAKKRCISVGQLRWIDDFILTDWKAGADAAGFSFKCYPLPVIRSEYVTVDLVLLGLIVCIFGIWLSFMVFVWATELAVNLSRAVQGDQRGDMFWQFVFRCLLQCLLLAFLSPSSLYRHSVICLCWSTN